MCLSPIKIKNPLHYSDPEIRKHMIQKIPYKNYTDVYIEVPCHHCKECIRKLQDGLVQRLSSESEKNHLFLCTLTYQDKYIPKLDINGRIIRYADIRDVQLFMKRLRRNNAFGIPFRFLAVSELGSERGRPHFHICFLFPKSYFPERKEDYIAACDAFASKAKHFFTCLKYWQRNYGSRRKPNYVDLCKYVEKYQNGHLRKNYDFHYVNPFLTSNGVEDCGYYVLKYMFKPSDKATKLQQALHLNLPESDYALLWSLIRPRYWSSLGFGFNAVTQLKRRQFDLDQDIIDKIRKDIDYSKGVLKYPAFFHRFTGKPHALSEYYKNHVLTHTDRCDFWLLANGKSIDNSDPTPYSQIKTFTQNQIQSQRYEKTQKHVDGLGVDAEFDIFD